METTCGDIVSSSGSGLGSVSGPSFHLVIPYGLLALARQELGFTAGAIVADNPQGGKDSPSLLVANLGYGGFVVDKLVQDFSQIEQRFPMLRSGRPLFWEDLSDFVGTDLAKDVLIPAGYSEGSSTSLRDDAGNSLGRMHFSFTDPNLPPQTRVGMDAFCNQVAALLLAHRSRYQLLTRLTPRELEVLQRIAAGQSNAEISRELLISGKTAAAHVANILAKTGSRSRTDIAVKATRLGIV